MKIVYISASTIPLRTANSVHVMKMCHAFAKNNHDVFLITQNNKKDIESNCKDAYEFYGVFKRFQIIKLMWLPFIGRSSIYGFLAARKAKSLKPDIVYSRHVAGAFFSSLFGLPVIFEAHQPVIDFGLLSDTLFKWLLIHPNFKKLIVITVGLKKYFLEKYCIRNYLVYVYPDGADPIFDEKASKHRPKKTKKPLQIGYIGHLYQGRGMHLIIEISNTCKWADFHIIGGTKTHFTYFKDLTKSQKNIYFHGFIPPAQVKKYLFDFDILLAPYQKIIMTSDGKGNTAQWASPLKLFEYMAAGKPIVSSNLPVLREILTHGYNAMLCDPVNTEDWIDTLTFLRDNKEYRNMIGGNAKNDFLKYYTWDSRAAKVLK